MRKNRLLLLIMIGVVALVMIVVFYMGQFRLTGSSLKDNVLPIYSNQVTLFFNKEIDPTYNINNISFTPSTTFTTNIDKKTITINLTDKIEENSKFSLVLKNVPAKSGDVLELVKVEGVVKYIPDSSLTKYEKERLIKQSDSFESKFPMINKLPVNDTEYTISYELPSPLDGENPNKLILIVDVIGVNDNLKMSPGNEAYLSSVRAKALENIKKLEPDSSKYIVTYSEK